MPEVLNPAEGFVVAANNRVVGARYRYPLAEEPSSDARARRITSLLRGQPSLTVAACTAMQGDMVSLNALRLRDLMVARIGVMDGNGVAAQQLANLKEWDGSLSPTSVAAGLYAELREALVARMLAGLLPPAHEQLLRGGSVHEVFGAGPYIGRLWPRLLSLLEEGCPDAFEEVDAPARDRLLREVLVESTGRGARAWGEDHTVTFEHPLAAAYAPLGSLLNRGPFPIGGDADTIHQSGGATTAGLIARAWAPFYRAVYDVSDWGASLAIHAPGQSGHPASPHYADLVDDWLGLRSRPLHFGPGFETRLTNLTRLTLTPGPPEA
jgi:penicillin amidase